MKATELRIGNYVSGNFEVPAKFESDDFKRLEDCPEYCKPIPLTEDWLFKLGFELEENLWYNKTYFTDCNEYAEEMGITINLKTKRCGVYDKDQNGLAMTGLVIKHVHQLQNLYFALTNKELIL